ncbi:MAG: hypothetical protein E7395_04930 [Ruminococcaceae bacterium]|nr:hypothetical protein [Oscillospiraceae bacterium]
MSIAEKQATISENNVVIADNVQKVYKAGQDSEYDRFWDLYQDNGNRASYYMGFAGVGWTDETFKPKYDINPSNCASLFIHSRITDIVQSLEESGITLDSSSCTDISSMFNSSITTRAPVVSAKAVWSVSNANGVFSNAKNLISVEKFIFVQTGVKKTCIYNNCFTNCSSLREIRFEGEVYRSLDLTASPLSVDSMKSLISCLGDYSTENTGVYTIGFSDTCWTALEADSTAPDGKTWRNYVETTLGWLT